jgi:hypothetical protein
MRLLPSIHSHLVVNFIMQDTTIKEKQAEVHRLVSPTEDSAALADPSQIGIPTQHQLSHGRLLLLVIGLGLSVSCVSLVS